MEMVWHLAGLLLVSGTAILSASPVAAPGCTLEPISGDQDIKVSYTTSRVRRGCTSRSLAGSDFDVHILYLNTSEVLSLQLNLSVSAAVEATQRKTVFVLGSYKETTWDVTVEDPQFPFSFMMSNGHIKGTGAEINETKSMSTSDDLFHWAKANYGAVTSFAELESPERITFHVGKVLSVTEDCNPQADFDAEPYLEARITSQNIKSCLASGGHHPKEAHILWLKQAPSESGTQKVEVNIKVTCREGNPAMQQPILLVLKSHEDLVWNLETMPESVKLLVSGKYFIKQFSALIIGETLPASEEGLIRAAQERNVDFIASYTEIPPAKCITLELVRVCEGPTTKATPKPQTGNLDFSHFFRDTVTKCLSQRCMDNSVEIALAKSCLSTQSLVTVTEVMLHDASCPATDNNTHFVLRRVLESCSTSVERGVFVKNEVVFNLGLLLGQMRVPFECILPEKVFLQLYPTADFGLAPTNMVEINQPAYVQISLRTADEEAEMEVEDCALRVLDQASSQLLIAGRQAQSYSVTFLNSPSRMVRRFSFIYKGGSEQLTVTPATLTCTLTVKSQLHGLHNYESAVDVTLENSNIPPHNQGLGIGVVLGITFGAFLIGVLLTAALWYIYSHTRPMVKRQPVLANPPASESSSTNQSIGSTQSTPCSTSSTA